MCGNGHYCCYEPMYGGLWPWVCVSMCVAGLSLDKGEGILTSQQIVAARPQAGRVHLFIWIYMYMQVCMLISFLFASISIYLSIYFSIYILACICLYEIMYERIYFCMYLYGSIYVFVFCICMKNSSIVPLHYVYLVRLVGIVGWGSGVSVNTR